MAWRWVGNNPLHEPMLTLFTDTYDQQHSASMDVLTWSDQIDSFW